MAWTTIWCLTDLYPAVSYDKLHKQNNLSILSNHFSIKRFHNVSKQLTSHPGFTICEERKRQSFDICKAAWFCRLTSNYSLLFTAVHICELKHRESVFGNFCPIWLFVAGKSQRSRRHGFVEKSRFITVPNIFWIISTEKLRQNVCHPFVGRTVICWRWFAVKFLERNVIGLLPAHEPAIVRFKINFKIYAQLWCFLPDDVIGDGSSMSTCLCKPLCKRFVNVLVHGLALSFAICLSVHLHARSENFCCCWITDSVLFGCGGQFEFLPFDIVDELQLIINALSFFVETSTLTSLIAMIASKRFSVAKLTNRQNSDSTELWVKWKRCPVNATTSKVGGANP